MDLSTPYSEASDQTFLYSQNLYILTGFSPSPNFILSPSPHLRPYTHTTLQGLIPTVLTANPLFLFSFLFRHKTIFSIDLSPVKQRDSFVPGLWNLKCFYVLYSFTKAVVIPHFTLSVPNYLFSSESEGPTDFFPFVEQSEHIQMAEKMTHGLSSIEIGQSKVVQTSLDIRNDTRWALWSDNRFIVRAHKSF